jgi:hypothetical protein
MYICSPRHRQASVDEISFIGSGYFHQSNVAARNDGTNRRYCISEDYRNVTEDGKEANDLGP